MERPDETTEFWVPFPKSDLEERCAALHRNRRLAAEAKGAEEVAIVRRTIAQIFIAGTGLEVGAGSRPFPLPPGATCFYGDVRDHSQLVTYFNSDDVTVTDRIDAQTMAGIPASGLDFIISAHVIEHVFNPLRAMKEAIRCLKPNGVLVLVAPDMNQTWDRRRPETSLEHVLGDERDDGEGTRLQAYIEHCVYVHPEMTGETLPVEDVERLARQSMANGMDLHVHAWSAAGFFAMIEHVAREAGCSIEARVTAVNENIGVIRRIA